MKTIFTCIFSSLLFIGSFSQNKIEGKVTDSKTGSALAGISVIVSGSEKGTSTDVEGRFVLNLSPGNYIIKLTSVGYKTKEVSDVAVSAGTVINLDVVMEPAAKTENEVIVRTTRRLESTAALISYQKNTNTVAQVISAEAIKRSPDKNTGEVLKRLPGTSVQDGRYLVVRGLSDRYNQAMLNGILLSSTEPDRKTFSFDIFPSSVIDNIIINKAFVPELSGEWAGGLVQINTKDFPSKNFLNFQVGLGFNTNVIGKDFYKYPGSNLDFLGFDNKVRSLPDNFPTRSAFSALSEQEKTKLALQFPNSWNIHNLTPLPNTSLQVNGGFSGKLFSKKLGGIFSLTYNRSIKHYEFENSFFSINNNLASPDFIYTTDKYAEEVLLGAMANFSLQINNNNKVSVKNLFNVNASNYTALRTGYEYVSVNDSINAKELALKTNTFFNTQISGDHNIPALKAKLNWFGSFNILDQYVPAQRRSDYLRNSTTGLYEARISTGQSQKSGSIFYSNLSDYIYTAGGDVTKNFQISGNKQSIKGGYFFQVKDRLYNARPFFVKLYDNSLKTLPEDQLFAPANFTPGKLTLDEFAGNQYRYIANSILNAGYLQLDNTVGKLRAVWGLRIENFDQVIGSMKQSDPRHVHNEVTDYLPALNFTYKFNSSTNIRLSGSQTVVRPEFRELSGFAFYDFELGATVLGNPGLQRTKISNADLRYEIYPKAGELITFGLFYKYFDKPIEVYFNQSGAGSSNTFNYQNADKAEGYGAELDIRKRLDFIKTLKNFTVLANLSYIYNRVKLQSGTQSLLADRPMQGQSPYIINTGLQYDVERYGINTTLLFNQTGRRIAYVGNDQIPAIWEAPRPLLDFQFAKKLMKDKAELKLNISDILNTKASFYHDLNDDGRYEKINDALAISRKYGTTFSLTFLYHIK